MELSHNATFLIEYLDLPSATDIPNAKWEAFQIWLLNNQDLFTIVNKARQIAWSWVCSAEAVAESVLHPRSTCIFVSINLDEASEKVRYALQITEALDKEVRPKITRSNKFELEFENGSRLISHPCRPVRGKAKALVYLDEFAHYPKDREIYTAALPVITKGGKIRIGSTPLGDTGMFWEIYSQKMRPFPDYVRKEVPWWCVDALCNNVKEASLVAQTLEVEERIQRFGTPRLELIFNNMLLEDFGQEYECKGVGDSPEWITWGEIKRNQVEDLDWVHAKTTEEAFEAIEVVAAKDFLLVGGMDVGRTRNLSEITFVESELPHSVRLCISLFNTEFDAQQNVVLEALKRLRVRSFKIDQTGLGMQLAEKAAKTYSVAEGITFTNQIKEEFCTNFKIALQRGEVPLPIDRDLTTQIHSIRKYVTPSKNFVFDTKGSEKHHADKFWALALALYAAKDKQVHPAGEMVEVDVGALFGRYAFEENRKRLL